MASNTDGSVSMRDVTITLELMIKHNISLLSPPEPGCTWCAQVWVHENNFIAEHMDPETAIRICLIELEEQGLLDRTPIESGEQTGRWHKWP